MDVLKQLTFISCCLLISCTTLKKTIESSEGVLQQPITEATPLTPSPSNTTTQPLSSWQLSGAMAARNKNKGWSAALRWVQQGTGTYHIRLSGPLGGGTVLIDKEGGVVTYRDGPKSIQSSNADDLLLKQTGIQLPVYNLYYWVQGLTAPGGASSKQYAGSQLVRFQQAGYTVTYGQYMRVGNRMLPAKVYLQGHGVVIKLVIKHWDV